MLEPAADKVTSRMGALSGPVGAATGAVLGLEAGAVSGFLAGRVLGQYEFPILDPDAPARLLFVAPNLAHAARTLDADPDELLRWVALHETTHALQFGAVPWLRPHLSGLVRELTAALDVDPGRLLGGIAGLGDLRGLLDSVREGGLAAVVIGPDRRVVLDRVQAFMAVLEGYAEHVMDAVGAELLPNLPRLRESLERRRHDRTGFLRLLERLIGMDLKLRQYEQGKAFCDGVVARAGHRGPEPGVGAPLADAHAGRARRSRRLAAPHGAGRRIAAPPGARPTVEPGSAIRSVRSWGHGGHTMGSRERPFRLSQSWRSFSAVSQGIGGDL